MFWNTNELTNKVKQAKILQSNLQVQIEMFLKYYHIEINYI